MTMKSRQRSDTRRHEETSNLAKQFLSAYDIILQNTFHSTTDGRRRKTCFVVLAKRPDAGACCYLHLLYSFFPAFRAGLG